MVTAKELLERNGDFHHSPLLETARRLHEALSAEAVPYVIVGGLAVVRNGAARTTEDVDILVNREAWARAQPRLQERFEIRVDHARDRQNGVPVDVLFPGNDWNLVVPLPEPAGVAEYDPELGASFLGLSQVLQLKTAVYLSKKREDGIELAAKDLADVVELLKANRQRVTPALLAELHPEIRAELERLLKKLRRSKRRP